MFNLTGQHNDQKRMAAYNTGLAKVAVQCSADTFVVNQSLVIRINICGENRHLRQARKRELQPLNSTNLKLTAINKTIKQKIEL